MSERFYSDSVNVYQTKAHEFADYEMPFVAKGDKATRIDYVYPALGLAEEAGEVAGKFAKAVRDADGVVDDKRKCDIIKELGDVMWFVAELATLLNVSLSTVLTLNINKLTDRKERNVIHGSGDER